MPRARKTALAAVSVRFCTAVPSRRSSGIDPRSKGWDYISMKIVDPIAGRGREGLEGMGE